MATYPPNQTTPAKGSNGYLWNWLGTSLKKFAAALAPYLNITTELTVTNVGGSGPATYDPLTGELNIPVYAGGSNSLTTNNIIYVAKNGNDTTGTVNRLDLPYLTVLAAAAAASAGTTIVVFPGEYLETANIVLETGVSYVFLGKGRMQRTTTGYLFTDNNTDVTDVSISAEGWNFNSVVYGVNLQNGVIKLAASSNIQMIVGGMSSLDTPVQLVSSSVGVKLPKLNLKVIGDITVTGIGTRGAVYSYGGYLTLEANQIQNFAGTDYGDGVLTIQQSPYINITAKRIIEHTEYGSVLMVKSGGVLTDLIYLNVDYMETDEGWVLYPEANCTIYADIMHMKSATDCLAVASGGAVLHLNNCTLEATMDTGATQPYYPEGIIHGEFGTVYATGCTIIRSPVTTGGWDLRTTGSGKIYIKSCNFNIARTRRNATANPALNMFIYNGSSWAKLPVNTDLLTNNPSDVIVTDSIIEGGTIFPDTFTGCSITNSIIKNSDILFTGNNQNLNNKLIINNNVIM